MMRKDIRFVVESLDYADVEIVDQRDASGDRYILIVQFPDRVHVTLDGARSLHKALGEMVEHLEQSNA